MDMQEKLFSMIGVEMSLKHGSVLWMRLLA